MLYINNLKTVESSNCWHVGGNRLLLLTKNALMKRWQKIWAGPPPLIWTKSKRTATFFRDGVPYFRSHLASYCVFDILVDGQIQRSIFALLPHSHFHILWVSSKFQLKLPFKFYLRCQIGKVSARS